MPSLTAIDAAAQYRAQLQALEQHAVGRLIDAYKMLEKRLQVLSDGLVADLNAMKANGEDVRVYKLHQMDRYKELLAQVEAEVTRYSAVVENEIDQAARTIIEGAGAQAKALVAASLPGNAAIDREIMATWNALNTGAIEQMLGFLAPDSPLRLRLRTLLGPAVSDRVAAKLTEGIGLGYNPRKVGAMIREATGEGLAWSVQTARTAMLYASREAARANYMANPQIVLEQERISARDDRVCLACYALDGERYPIDAVIDDHYSGRCIGAPIPITYKDLGMDIPEPGSTDEWLAQQTEEKQREYLGPKRYDAWKSGDLRFSENARSWFERQTEEAQRRMMGPQKYTLWREGKIGWKDFVTHTDDPVYGSMTVESTLKSLLDAIGGGR